MFVDELNSDRQEVASRSSNSRSTAELFERLNLDLSWERYKRDLVERSFADHPYEGMLIERNRRAWLTDLRGKLKRYTPSRCEIVDVLKPNFHLRPGSRLTASDAVLYQALLLDGVKQIRDSLLWSAAKQRFAYILNEDQSAGRWFTNEYQWWTNFRNESLRHIEQGYSYVVFADVSAYFENISLVRLNADLCGFGVAEDTLRLLMHCLNRWAEPRSRGIPQGCCPSFILGEVYMNSIDRRLHNDGLIFCRYVDDLRIFCRSHDEAVKALHVLTVLLREKELNLQTAKSFIKSNDEARKEVEGIVPVIRQLEQSLREDLTDTIGATVEYATPSAIEALLEREGEAIELESLRRAFTNHFSDQEKRFDKSLFHYCLNRLGAAGDAMAVKVCFRLLVSEPQETESILRYFAKLPEQQSSLIDAICALFLSQSLIVDHQIYLFLRHIFVHDVGTMAAVSFARKQLKRSDLNDYTKDYARGILGKFGDSADLDALESDYARVSRDISKAAIICSIRRMVKTRRNAVYSRAEGESQIIKFAVDWAKNSQA